MKNDRKIKKNQFSTNSYKTQQRITEKEGQIAKKKKKKILYRCWHWTQERSEGTPSVAFKVLLIKSEINSINLFSFNCLTSSIRGTNNQIRNKCYKSVHLQLFDVKFLLSEEHIFCKQNRIVVYGRASIVLGFQLTWENDDLLSSRHN